MNTGTTRNRWTNKEIKLLKDTLKSTCGNQKDAAIVAGRTINRSLPAIRVKLCLLAQKHRSLRKSYIINRMQINAVADKYNPPVIRKIKTMEINGDKIIITLK